MQLRHVAPNNIVYSLCVKSSDTNLAESLQRISGVSIDRSASSEGFTVTVRGVVVAVQFHIWIYILRERTASA